MIRPRIDERVYLPYIASMKTVCSHSAARRRRSHPARVTIGMA